MKLRVIEDLNNKKSMAKDFANSIDLKPLFDRINNMVGGNLDYDINISDNVGYSRAYCSIDYISNDMKDYCGVFGKLFKSCVVKPSYSGIYFDDDDNMYFWTQPNLRYEFKQGGSNGTTLFDAVYTNERGWEFTEPRI